MADITGGRAVAWIAAALLIVVAVVYGVRSGSPGGEVTADEETTTITEGLTAIAEGKEFGATTNNSGCVADALSHPESEPGFVAGVQLASWLNACLENSTPTPGFCDDVPKSADAKATEEWRATKCRLSSADEKTCGLIYAGVQRFCLSRP